MRVFILSFFWIISSSYSIKSYSQNATIKIEADMALDFEQVFELIKSKTDYQFIYRYDLVQDAPKVNISKGVITLKELLKEVLSAISCVYDFKNERTIIVKRKTALKAKNSLKKKSRKLLSSKNITIEATLLDKQTKQPIVYANIGFIKKGLGTISNEKGHFKLTFDEIFLGTEEVLQISTLGYETLQLNAKQLINLLAKTNVLLLNPEPLALNQVLITDQRKQVRLGNFRSSKSAMGYWKDKKALGGEIATKINIKKKNTRLLDLKFKYFKTLSDSLKIRVNVYDYNKRFPTKKILKENIFHIIKQKEGIVTIDLKPYDIKVSDDIIISIELIKVYGETINFGIYGEPHGGVAFKRYISQDKWKRFDLVGMNFSVLTSVLVPKSKRALAVSKESKTIIENTSLSATIPNTSSEESDRDNIKAIKNERIINGTVTNINALLQNVNIKIKDKVLGTKTDAQGNYTIKTNIGDILEFSHVGYYKTSIIIEDVTRTLNIEMVQKNNVLDEVLVKQRKKKSKVLELFEKSQKPVVTSRGTLDPKRATYPITFIDGEEVLPIYPTLAQALAGKRAGISVGLDNQGKERIMVKPGSSLNNPIFAIWDVDGQIFELEPPMDLTNIKSINILKTFSGTNKYGSTGAGGVVVVRTKYGTFEAAKAERDKIAAQFTNKNYYEEDASKIDDIALWSSTYSDTLKTLNNAKKAYIYYNETLKIKTLNYNTHIGIVYTFINFYKDTSIAIKILNNLSLEYKSDPEILKAIGFQLQVIGATKDAANVYKSIFKLRPSYAQSYRDLANAYIENDQFKKAWRLYMNYLLQGHNALDQGIGQTMYNEMEFLYFNRKNQTKIKELFQPKSKDLNDFRNDVRIVFEWNTSEAEFDLEFVAPDKRAYVFEHTLFANQELIADEKRRGYSSKEFFVDTIDSGKWLINLTYKGNKKPEPTYFKLTTYYNWGKPNQRHEVKVYKFQDERYKVQLLKINKELLLASK